MLDPVAHQADATLRVASKLSDPVGPLEVGLHKDVEQFGAGSRTERVEAFSESEFKVMWTHEAEPRLRQARG